MSKRGFTPIFPVEGSTAVLDAPESATETAIHPDIARLETLAELTSGQDGSVDAQGTFTPESAPEIPQTPPVALSQLQEAHAKLTATPDQLPNPSSESPDALRARLAAIPQETLRKIAAEHQGGAVTLPDGSIRIPVTIPAEMVEIIRSWADGAGLPFEEYLDQHVLTCLTAGTLA
jgi:hypothetical protein